VEYARVLQLGDLLARKSFFLFGPRTTGKSYLIRQTLGDRVLLFDLLRGDLLLRLAADPTELESWIEGDPQGRRTVVLDEIQKLPSLLDEVHRLIEGRGMTFLLTGSSARKLRRGAANLLAGRAWRAELFPLTAQEIPDFDLDRFLRFGGLPPVQLSEDPAEELAAYVSTYLYEEIQAEGLVRKLPAFSRFITTAALCNGRMLNFAALASDAAVPASTVREYYSILTDTLVGFLLEPWTKSRKRKAIATAKFYFFDTGVVHALAGTQHLDRNSDLYGRSFEQWIGMELRAFLSYRRLPLRLAYWRSTHGHEVDFVVGDELAVEAKATRRVSRRDLHGLRALGEEGTVRQLLLVSHDPVAATQDGIRRLPWQAFLEALWGGQLLG